MKKMYIAPSVEINETVASQMMALSFKEGLADDSPVLVQEEEDWDLWK